MTIVEGVGFSEKNLQNLTLAFCIGGTNCTYLYARTVEDETCCRTWTRYLYQVLQYILLYSSHRPDSTADTKHFLRCAGHCALLILPDSD
jgi:hypothetical protein